MEDTYIIDLFWRRDENAIKLVDKKYNAVCYSIAWKILTNREDSEECVNDTWFAAWRYIPPKRPPRLVAFLGKITRGLAIDMLRKKYAAKRMDMHITDITEEVESLNTAIIHDLDEHIFDILCLLAKRPGQVFSKEQIYSQVWKEPYYRAEDNVASLIHRIRKKVEPDPSNPIYVLTVWGMGYRFSPYISRKL